MTEVDVLNLKPGDIIVARAQVVAQHGEEIELDFSNGVRGVLYPFNHMVFQGFERYPRPATNPGTAPG